MARTTRADGYVTDVAYVRKFEPDLSPLRLALAAALNGFAPPPVESFDYCELGCAHGDTTATLAAAYPEARFVGVDILPEHIASARVLVEEGGLSNATFLERDFEGLTSEPLPDFDFIVAHGVWSWVSAPKRAAAIELVKAKLKPGGLLYVSYNALPGWAALEPLRQLIASQGDPEHDDSTERARRGFELAKKLSAAGAGYFAANPGARDMLKTMGELGLPYIVHEYLHANWAPMYFAQAAAELAASDLYFVGQLPLHLNFRDLAIPPGMLELFRGMEDRVAFEGLKDYALNEFFRRDVYMKGRRGRDEAAAKGHVNRTPFGVFSLEGGLPRYAELPHQTLHFTGKVFDPLIPALEEGAASPEMLAAREGLRELGAARIRDAVIRLALGGHLSPMSAPTRRVARVASAKSAPLRVIHPYNHAALARALREERPAVISVPNAGSGVELSMVDAVALSLHTSVPRAERDRWLAELCRRPTFKLTVSGRPVTAPEDRVHVLEREAERFSERAIPKLMELGVLGA